MARVTGAITSPSVITFTQAGLPLANARSSAGRSSSGFSTSFGVAAEASGGEVVARGVELGDDPAVAAVDQVLAVGRHAPELVVVHDHDDRQAVADHRVELGEVQPHGAVAHDAEHPAVRVGDLGRNREGHPGAQAAEIAVRHPRAAAGDAGDHIHPRGGLASVRCDDRAVGQALHHLMGQAIGMDRRIAALQRLGEHQPMTLAQARDGLLPVAPRRPVEGRRRLVEGAHRLAAVGGDAQIDVPIAADLLGRDVDLDQLCALGNQPRAASAHEEAEARAENQHHVGGTRPGRGRGGQGREAVSTQRVIGGHHPVRLAVAEDGDAGSLRKAQHVRLSAGEPGAAAEQDGGPLRSLQPLDGLTHRLGGRGGGALGQRSSRGSAPATRPAGVKSTSIGSSRKTGPGRPVVAIRNAWATRSGMRSGWVTRCAHLVIGWTIATWSSPPCKGSVSASRRGAAPAT